ncbi:hypothetical protein PR048_010661, partial [Dryococelus australis]
MIETCLVVPENRECGKEGGDDKLFCLSLYQNLQKVPENKRILTKMEILNVMRIAQTYSNQHYCHHRALKGTGTVNILPLWELTMPTRLVNIRWLHQLDLTASTGIMNKCQTLYHDRLNIVVMQPTKMLHSHLKARGNITEYSVAQNAPTLQVEVLESRGTTSRQNAPTPSPGHMESHGNPHWVSGNLMGQQAAENALQGLMGTPRPTGCEPLPTQSLETTGYCGCFR